MADAQAWRSECKGTWRRAPCEGRCSDRPGCKRSVKAKLLWNRHRAPQKRCVRVCFATSDCVVPVRNVCGAVLLHCIVHSLRNINAQSVFVRFCTIRTEANPYLFKGLQVVFTIKTPRRDQASIRSPAKNMFLCKGSCGSPVRLGH